MPVFILEIIRLPRRCAVVFGCRFVPCYAPLRGVLVQSPGGQRISFNSRSVGKGLSLPCGRCIGCRLERARQWAVRIMHETKMHSASSFLTLTFDDAHLPKDKSLSVKTCQLFIKKLRFAVGQICSECPSLVKDCKHGKPVRIRFFLCGEYGELCDLCGNGRRNCRCFRKSFSIGRPHYHAVVFGYDFPDKVYAKKSGEFTLYTSKLLSCTWGNGNAWIGNVTMDSASYVASYAVKKIVGKKEVVDAHYKGKTPEFVLMSRRPGIGRGWFERFTSDVYPSDEVVVGESLHARLDIMMSCIKCGSPIRFEVFRSDRSVKRQSLKRWSSVMVA